MSDKSQPDRFQRVEPTPFDAPGAAAPPPVVGAADSAPPKWMIPAIGGLAVLALIVVFVLPSLVDTSPPATPPSGTSDSGASQDRSTSSPSRETESNDREAASPFADAVAAKARSEAQDLLAELLDVKENLEAKGVESWAPEEYAAVTAEATAGDEVYREREFEPAIGHYEKALELALALEQSIPDRFDATVASGVAAIEALDLEGAQTALALAEQLDDIGPGLDSLRTRTASLPALTELITNSQDEEESGDLAAATGTMKEATDLDGEHVFAEGELTRLSAALNQQRFNAAMSEGYAALDDARFDTAQQRFERAASLQPGSSEAAAALQELSIARTADKLTRLNRKADELAAEEDWTAAIAVYEEALAIDGSLRFAREGLAIAQPRAALNKELTAILDKPERLVDAAILREAQASVERARSVENPGSKIAGQIERAEEVLRIASTPVPVLLRSDGETNVTVYKIARFGQLAEREMNLRPGKYTAVGTRRGYRDVRVVFEVMPGGIEPVYVACTETI